MTALDLMLKFCVVRADVRRVDDTVVRFVKADVLQVGHRFLRQRSPSSHDDVILVRNMQKHVTRKSYNVVLHNHANFEHNALRLFWM